MYRPRLVESRSGRIILEDSEGEFLVVYGPADPRAPRIGYRPLEGAILFESATQTRLLAPRRELGSILSRRSWRDVAAARLCFLHDDVVSPANASCVALSRKCLLKGPRIREDGEVAILAALIVRMLNGVPASNPKNKYPGVWQGHAEML
jgi:hypothetical protein